jgi:hypothetical protein
MRRHILVALAGLLVVCSGCDTDRINKLEKENADLKAAVDRKNAATDLNLQEKCSAAARNWFSENYRRERTTVFLDETNHFNKKLNKCFVVVENHENDENKLTFVLWSWYNNIQLWDVFENSRYADFTESHTTFTPSLKRPDEDTVDECEVAGTKCKSLDEFNNLTRSYMSD